MNELKETIKEFARGLGFSLCGITSAEPLPFADKLQDTIDQNRIGTMAWLSRNPAGRMNPASILAGARSVICCAYPYGDHGICGAQADNSTVDIRRARFARGADYHKVVKENLGKLWMLIRKEFPDANGKICVDTSPILEKALAHRAGLGWIGKHTVLVNKDIGSWFVLGEIVTDLEIDPDAPVKNLCGDCRACIDACPTRAIVAPQTLDARRCISYLTLEHRGQAPLDLREYIKEGAHGCDLCQEVCKYNKI